MTKYVDPTKNNLYLNIKLQRKKIRMYRKCLITWISTGLGTKWNVIRIECTMGQTSFEIHFLILIYVLSTFYQSWFQNFAYILYVFLLSIKKWKWKKISPQRDKVIQKCNFNEGFYTIVLWICGMQWFMWPGMLIKHTFLMSTLK